MTIRIHELRRAFEGLVSHLENRGVAELDLPWDYYWDFAPGAMFKVGEPPPELVVGQLSEDWERLSSIFGEAGLPVGYGFVWLASLCRAAGERYPY